MRRSRKRHGPSPIFNNDRDILPCESDLLLGMQLRTLTVLAASLEYEPDVHTFVFGDLDSPKGFGSGKKEKAGRCRGPLLGKSKTAAFNAARAFGGHPALRKHRSLKSLEHITSQVAVHSK